MLVKSFENAASFQQAALPFMLRSEAQNCLGIGIVDALVKDPKAFNNQYFWTVSDGKKVVGASWLTAPHPIGLTDMPDEALDALVEAATRIAHPPTSVVGPRPYTDVFAQRWTAKHKQSIKSTMSQRIYQLENVTVPFEVPGTMRLAVAEDQALLEDWNMEFTVDCRLNGTREQAKEQAVKAVANGSRYLWMLDGRPVAMAAASGTTPSGIRINWVYTPKNLRGKGYATVLVARVSQKMLDEGRKFCFLYTDITNPTSNSIYMKIGYRAVCDSALHTFG